MDTSTNKPSVQKKPRPTILESKKSGNRFSSLFDDGPKSKDEPHNTESNQTEEETNGGRNTISKEMFDVAGEMVTVSKEVSAHSTEAKMFLKSHKDGAMSQESVMDVDFTDEAISEEDEEQQRKS